MNFENYKQASTQFMSALFADFGYSISNPFS